MKNLIIIRGAKENNLKNINVEIPKKKIVVVTGVSGSGKSSLIFNTLYAESQRQYLESLGSFAMKNLPKFSKPDVEEIIGATPPIIIDQRRLGNSSRSTVGTVTEIYTYLRLLFSRIGTPTLGNSRLFSFNSPEGMCKKCHGLGVEEKINPKSIIDFEKSLNQGAIKINKFKPNSRYFNIIKTSKKLDLDKPIKSYSKEELDFLLYSPKIILSNKDQGFIQTFSHEGIINRLKKGAHDPRISGQGRENKWIGFFEQVPCSECSGSRINQQARSVKVQNKTIPDLVNLELLELQEFIKKIKSPLTKQIVDKIEEQLENLIKIGLGYLSINQSVSTLSGGESQRVKMSSQLGINLVDLTYILDEPSIGLHPKDISHLTNIIKKLKEKGNNIIVVEHDPEIIKNAEYIIDIGPRAGKQGGELIFQGTLNELKNSKSITAKYLYASSKIKKEHRKPKDFIKIEKANIHNLKNISTKIPKGIFTCVTGVAGSGKSSLINDIFVKEHPESIIVDQSPVGKSIRSNPATYTGVFNLIRKEFAKATKKSEGLFSFNSKGACPKCGGIGFLKVDMHFLESVKIACEECQGKRFTKEVLELKYKGKNIREVLDMTITQAIDFFENKEIKRRLNVLKDVGLGYLELGQPLDSLSGGEAQRIKLSKELHKKGNIYILDEPTTGLHMADIEKLIVLLNNIVEEGNTVVVIEHNLDIIKNADYIIDMGPEGGKNGGEIIAEGTPEEISKNKNSVTGRYLK